MRPFRSFASLFAIAKELGLRMTFLRVKNFLQHTWQKEVPMAMLQDAKAESIEQVLAYIRDRLPQGKAAHIAAFANEYYRWAAPEDLSGRSPLDLYGAAMAHWNLAQ